jgi:hypothetical protein
MSPRAPHRGHVVSTDQRPGLKQGAVAPVASDGSELGASIAAIAAHEGARDEGDDGGVDDNAAAAVLAIAGGRGAGSIASEKIEALNADHCAVGHAQGRVSPECVDRDIIRWNLANERDLLAADGEEFEEEAAGHNDAVAIPGGVDGGLNGEMVAGDVDVVGRCRESQRQEGEAPDGQERRDREDSHGTDGSPISPRWKRGRQQLSRWRRRPLEHRLIVGWGRDLWGERFASPEGSRGGEQIERPHCLAHRLD